MGVKMRIPAFIRAIVIACGLACAGVEPCLAASGEFADKAATFLAVFIIIVMPIGGVVLFWLVHILPEKAAEKRHHPQKDAIQVLCLLSLVFGGLLWPLAWLWAYSKPVMHKLAYGRDKHDDYYAELGGRRRREHEGCPCTRNSGGCGANFEAFEKRAELPDAMKGIRERLAKLEGRVAGAGTSRGRRLMEALLLGIYSFFVWLIFFKFKWLPWNTTSQVTVVVIPIVALTTLILMLNVYAPSSADVRVIKYVVQVVPQVRGRVIEVPIEPNSQVKKGDVLFRIDPTPFALQVNTLEAQLAATEGSVQQLNEELSSAVSRTKAERAKLELARTRVKQYRELAESGAGDRFALEQAEADVRELEASVSCEHRGRGPGPGPPRRDSRRRPGGSRADQGTARAVRAGNCRRPFSMRRPMERSSTCSCDPARWRRRSAHCQS